MNFYTSIVFVSVLFAVCDCSAYWCGTNRHRHRTLGYPYRHRYQAPDRGLLEHSTFEQYFKVAKELAEEALRHIEAKYPHLKKRQVAHYISLHKLIESSIHYKLKIKVGFTKCPALSAQTNCRLRPDPRSYKDCLVDTWVRPWNDSPYITVSCDGENETAFDSLLHKQAEHLFNNFLVTHKPSYVDNATEKAKRFDIFKMNVRKIHDYNSLEKGTATYGVTRFTDLTYEEFKSRHSGLKILRDDNDLPMAKAVIPDIELPGSVDWRESGAVTPVKDQGVCGGCWAFSVIGNIEGQWKIKSGNLVSLSEQELLDCDEMNDGCDGGSRFIAYRAVEQLGGLQTEAEYPYTGVQHKCAFNKTLSKAQIKGSVNITSNETSMAKWLAQHGPISIGLNSNVMQFYLNGISHPLDIVCNPDYLDHGVLLVGYGTENYPELNKLVPYWLIKNSWGESWGEQGYYRVYRGDGTCGVNRRAFSAVV